MDSSLSPLGAKPTALGKDEVASSNLASSSKKALEPQRFLGFCFFSDILTAKKTTTKTTT